MIGDRLRESTSLDRHESQPPRPAVIDDVVAAQEIETAASRITAIALPRRKALSEMLDRTAFERLAEEIDLEGAMETFAVFHTDTQRRLLALATIELEAHRNVVQIEAHSLKSAAAMFGFIQLASLAAGLEAAAMTIDVTTFGAVQRDLGSAFATGVVQFEQAFRRVA